MKSDPSSVIPAPPLRRGGRISCRSAFTLVEMLTVIVIIGIILSIGIPGMRGITSANKMAAANRQLLDDISSARLRAINSRSSVFMVFVPPEIHTVSLNLYNREEEKQIRSLLNGVFTSYALFSKRSVGEQPGRESPRYLTEWKTMPDGILIPPYKVIRNNALTNSTDAANRPFDFVSIPFPTAKSPLMLLPAIQFNPQGQLARGRDEVIPMARGRIFYLQDATGEYQQMPAGPTVLETPPGNATNDINQVRIDWLTGRGRIERPELP